MPGVVLLQYVASLLLVNKLFEPTDIGVVRIANEKTLYVTPRPTESQLLLTQTPTALSDSKAWAKSGIYQTSVASLIEAYRQPSIGLQDCLVYYRARNNTRCRQPYGQLDKPAILWILGLLLQVGWDKMMQEKFIEWKNVFQERKKREKEKGSDRIQEPNRRKTAERKRRMLWRKARGVYRYQYTQIYCKENFNYLCPTETITYSKMNDGHASRNDAKRY